MKCFPFSFSSFRLLGKVDVPLGELLSSKEAEREYDLLDGKNNPTMVGENNAEFQNPKTIFISQFWHSTMFPA